MDETTPLIHPSSSLLHRPSSIAKQRSREKPGYGSSATAPTPPPSPFPPTEPEPPLIPALSDPADLEESRSSSTPEGPHCEIPTPISERSETWWSAYDPQLTLLNTGSVARDHLASERTFLAYVRTSLGLVAMGVVLMELFELSAANTVPTPPPTIKLFARPLGVTTVALGIIVLAIGVTRYFMTQYFLVRGRYPVARFTVGSIAVALCGLVVLTFSILIVESGQ